MRVSRDGARISGWSRVGGNIRPTGIFPDSFTARSCAPTGRMRKSSPSTRRPRGRRRAWSRCSRAPIRPRPDSNPRRSSRATRAAAARASGFPTATGSPTDACASSAEKIEVEYRDLPTVVDAEEALAPGAEQLYPEIPGNLCFDYEYGDEAGTLSAFAQAAHVTRITLDSKRMVGNPMEPKACLAAYDAADDRYDLYVSSQGLSLMRGSASGITGIPAERIMVRAQDVGGGFGIRSDAYAEYCVAMLAAKTLGKPVKWTSTRSETFLSDYHGRAAQ